MTQFGKTIEMSEELNQYLDDRTVVNPETGCWEWVGHIVEAGYGRVTFRKNIHYAHRVSYTRHVSPVPSYMVIDHLCRNRRCVNPAHLEAVTQKTNVIRGESPGAKAIRRTHCAVGHDFETYGVVRAGRRVCRECRRVYSANYQATHRTRAGRR